MNNKKDKSGEIHFNNPFNNDFEIPTSNQEINPNKEVKVKNEISLPSKAIIIPKKPIVKIGFELPEDLDRQIEFIALDENKKKKDLLAEIIGGWVSKRNKTK